MRSRPFCWQMSSCDMAHQRKKTIKPFNLGNELRQNLFEWFQLDWTERFLLLCVNILIDGTSLRDGTGKMLSLFCCCLRSFETLERRNNQSQSGSYRLRSIYLWRFRWRKGSSVFKHLWSYSTGQSATRD